MNVFSTWHLQLYIMSRSSNIQFTTLHWHWLHCVSNSSQASCMAHVSSQRQVLKPDIWTYWITHIVPYCILSFSHKQTPSGSSRNCYMRLVRGAVLSPTLIGSALTHSYSEVNAVDFVRRTCRGSTNYLKTPTLLCFIKSPLTVVTSCISFYRHFRRPHRTIVCIIELVSSACPTTQDALWIVTFLLGPCSRMFINSF